jgi:hypothetical protein
MPVVSASETVPTVVLDETWITERGQSVQCASKPNIRNGAGPSTATAYPPVTRRRCARRLMQPSG